MKRFRTNRSELLHLKDFLYFRPTQFELGSFNYMVLKSSQCLLGSSSLFFFFSGGGGGGGFVEDLALVS